MYSSFSNKFRQIKPYDNYNVTDVPWHEAMVAGNGRLGVLESCAPIEDSLIYQNVEFVIERAKTCALRCYSTVV